MYLIWVSHKELVHKGYSHLEFSKKNFFAFFFQQIFYTYLTELNIKFFIKINRVCQSDFQNLNF